MSRNNSYARRALILAAAVLLGGGLQAQEDELDALFDEATPAAEDEAAEKGPVGVIPLPQQSPAPVPPERAPPARVIEEVVVVAQKRAQREIDVPIAISVLDAEFIAEQGIVDLADMSVYVPNAKITSAAVFPDIRIRGFGTSPLNPVFEQSVGIVLDGVPYGNKTFYQGALFDIAHVEVLRGPQGALHGKNTTAGLINVITKGPSEVFSADLNAQFGDLDTQRIEAGISAPLIEDKLQFRIAALSEQRGGYFSNTMVLTDPEAPSEPGARDREALRLKLAFPALGGSDLTLTYEYSHSLINGGYELRQVPEHTRDFVGKYDPNADFEPYNLVGSFDAPDFVDIRVNAGVLNWDLDIGEWGLTLVGGYARLQDAFENDSDFSPTPGATTRGGRTTTQSTAELRLHSPELGGLLGIDSLFGRELGSTEFIGGLLLQRRAIGDLFTTMRLNDQLIGEFAATEQSGGLTVPVIIPDLPADDEQSTIFYDDSARTLAVFGQADWQLLPAWTLSLGLRWSEESREAEIRRVFDTANNVLFTQVLNWQEFDRALSRSETQTSPKISLNWQPVDGVSLFLSWANAYKAGGFNAFASGGSDRELAFEPEVVSQWGFDAKLRFGEGRHSLNLSLFRMDLEDFQVLTADPNDLAITIENASQALSQGVEADWTWLPAEWFDVRAALGFNDTEYVDFAIATCPQDRPNSDGDDEERCDVSGKPLVRAPRWSGTFTPTVTLPFSAIPGLRGLFPNSELGLVASLTGEYQSEQSLNDDLDERKRQTGFWRLHGGIGIGNIAQTWSFRIAGYNLTDTRTAVAVGEVPAVAPAHFYQIPEPGRIVYGQFRLNF